MRHGDIATGAWLRVKLVLIHRIARRLLCDLAAIEPMQAVQVLVQLAPALVQPLTRVVLEQHRGGKVLRSMIVARAIGAVRMQIVHLDGLECRHVV